MIYFIVNTTAKTGKSFWVWKQVREYLADWNVPYKAFRTKYAGHARLLARQISGLKDEDIRLAVLGGDGTINEVINGIVDFEHVKLGIIPAGSGNDFAKGANISFDLEANLLAIVYGKQTTVCDLGLVSYEGCSKPRYFAISSGVGFDAIVCKKTNESKLKQVLNKFGLGKLAYLMITVSTLISMRTTCGKIIFDKRHTVGYNRLIFSASMNMRAEGGGVPMAPEARMDNGKLVLCTAYGIPTWQTFFELPFLVLGQHKKRRCFSLKSYETMDIVLSEPMTLHADGEYLSDTRKIHIECVPGVLRLLK
ncbi:MAG: diacylglycerol kinase family lipid kinase [Eubacteriales bacterium]|nr:diacylglycerol kinase family lipid kinase [Lachnospiraceae bacterium]MDO5127262.1 diacylglycerol kinase family lipid kinase [Eubacteriales bacterium]